MYKKITHTIVEEHFDHPMATEIKSSVDNYTKPSRASAVSAVSWPLAVMFRLNARNYFSKLKSSVRNVVVDIIEPSDSMTSTKLLEQVLSDIGALSGEVTKYYGDLAGMEFDKLLGAFVMSAVEYVKTLKEGKDTFAVQAKCDNAIADIAKFLSGANPDNWPASAVTSIFTDYSRALVAQADALIKKDRKAAIDAENMQHDILLGNSVGRQGLSDVFAKGIIQQFPSEFTY
jgi:hypothetical protein